MADQYLNAQIDDDTELWQKFEEFREEQGHESKSEAVRAAVRRGVMTDDEPSSRFQFWTRLNLALWSAVKWLVVAAVAAAGLAAVTGSPVLADWGMTALQTAALAFAGMIGTMLQQARVRREEEGIPIWTQARRVAGLYTKDTRANQEAREA